MTEREKLVGELENYEPYAMHFPHLTVDGKLVLDTLTFLREQPEIVRCKDCKNWIPGWVDDYDTFIPPRCKRNSGVWASNDYCSYVDRKVKQDETD